MAHSRGVMGVALGVTLLLTVVLALVGAPLATAHAPIGILSLEFAWTADAANEMLADWGPLGIERALLVQALDVVYPISYGLTGVLLGHHRGSPGAAWAFAVAAGLDGLVENPLLDLALWTGTASPAGTAIASVAASLKFLLVAVGIGLLVRRRS